MMWRYPPMLELAQKAGVYIVDLEYCQFSEDWRKSTRLLTNREDVKVLGKCCRGSSAKCLATKEAHQALRGTAPSGELWTKVAC
eukprot:3083740-Heterocapsa_arctica.AAC.1